jgi:hypothetical protein
LGNTPQDASIPGTLLDFFTDVPISYFFIQDTKNHAIRNVTLSKQMQDTLAELGPSTPDAGRLGILQVVVSYPGEPDQAVMDKFVFNEPDGHPLAVVDMTKMVSSYEGLQTLLSLRKRVTGNQGNEPSSAKKAEIPAQ